MKRLPAALGTGRYLHLSGQVFLCLDSSHKKEQLAPKWDNQDK